MIWRTVPGKKRTPMEGLLRGRTGGEEPTISVEDWLDRVESPTADEAINEPGDHESNGNAHDHSAGFPVDPRLDQSEEREG